MNNIFFLKQMLWNKKAANFFLNVLFPKYCFGCQKEGSYLCPDCASLIEIMEGFFCLCQRPQRLPEAGKCPKCRKKNLNGLYFAVSFKNNLIKKLIYQFKYEPYAREISFVLASLIITHLDLTQKHFLGKNCALVPVPLTKRKLKQRGFNQSEEIAKTLSEKLKIPLITNCLMKIRETPPQMQLSRQEREKNLKDAFSLKNNEFISDKKILLVDDVYTTGATMDECARVLKGSGAKEVWGVVVAREE